MVAGIDDGTGAEEEQRLEESVRVKMEHGRMAGIRAVQLMAVLNMHGHGTDGHDHVAQLGESRVSEHTLDVVLLSSHQGGHKCGETTDARNDFCGEW